MLKMINEQPSFLYDKELDNEYVFDLKELKEGEKISILSDSMFKTMILNTSRIKYSAKLFSYFLDVDYEYLLKNIKFTKSHFDKKTVKNKGIIGDYLAEIDGSFINLEINNNSSVDAMERNTEYACRAYGTKNQVGKEYEYTEVLQININNFAFKGNDKIVDRYRLRNEEGLVLNKKITIVQIYVPNIRKKWYTSGIENLSEAERYILSMTETDIDTSLELGRGMDIVEDYVNEAILASKDEMLLESYNKEWALMDEGIRQGKIQGFEEGKIAQKNEMIVSMLKEKLDINLISKVTNLSVEEINDIKNKI